VADLAGWTVVPRGLFWSLATVLVTLLLGRVFCGWICPLGAVHAIASRLVGQVANLPSKRQIGNRPQGTGKPGHAPWSPWQLTKYYVLVAMLAMSLVGGHWGTIFDPLVLLYRTTATALFPAAQGAVEDGSTAVYQSQPDQGPFRPGVVTEPVYGYLRDHVFTIPEQAFLGSGFIVAVFVVTLLLNAYRPRFWCRYLCPLGGLLGLFSRRPLLQRTVRQESCNQCDLCGRACHGAAAAAPGRGWMAAECLGCFHCSGSCPRGALAFQWKMPWQRAEAAQPIDLGKRATLGAAVGGLTALALARATPQSRGRVFNPALVRPPGAREEREFLARCTACGMCMKVCPTGGLQPCWSEAGLEGLWTPRLVPNIGHCDFNCNLCGQVCPTEAIRPLPLAEKQQTKIGLAAFNITRCIPYAYGRDCMVCEEHCPIPTKAIYTIEVEVQDHDGQKSVIKQPRVDPKRCIGCGNCVSACVFKDRPAIAVFSANESRHPQNQAILVDDAAGGSPYPGT
jgi:polyferredoxin